MLDQTLWRIETQHGYALRGEREVKEADNGAIEITGIRPEVVPARAETFERLMFSLKDMPDFAGRTEIRNVCGFVVGYSEISNHPAWRRTRSTLGNFNEAYTLRGGNCIFLRGKVIFKGGTDRTGVHQTMLRLVKHTNIVLKAYLVVATTHLHRNLFVQSGCLMEQLIAQHPGCRVMQRHEELSNAIIFYVKDWSDFDIPKDRAPDQGTISVSRRGVVNARFTWHDGSEWEDNATWVRLTESVRLFLLRMC
jgi:hypothetical protein